MREGDGAIVALQFVAAGAAHDDEGIAAPIQQQHGLFAATERRFNFLRHCAGEQGFLAGLGKFLAHVDQRNFRQGAIADALLQREQRIFATLDVGPRLQRRRGRTEDDGGAGQLGAHHSDIASVIAGQLRLLVGSVMLLVDDNQREVGDGRKDSGASADDDVGFAAADAMPLRGAFRGAERGVQECDLIAEGEA